jgi:hypothetical protein
MGRLLKAVALIALIGVIALIGFAIFSDLPAPEREISIPVEPR